MDILFATDTEGRNIKALENVIVFAKGFSWLCLVLMPWTLLAMLCNITDVVALSELEFSGVFVMLLGAVVQIVLCSKE